MKTLSITTKTGSLVRIETDPLGKLYITKVYFSHPCILNGKEVFHQNSSQYIEMKDGQKGIHFGYWEVNGKRTEIFLSFNEPELQKLQDYFDEITAEKKEKESKWIEINLGVCFHSDYSCHHWAGTVDTPIDQIITESEQILTCCHKPHPEKTKEKVKTALTEWYAKKENAKIHEEKMQAAFAEAKQTGKQVQIGHYIGEIGDESESYVGNIYVYAMPNGTTKHVGI